MDPVNSPAPGYQTLGVREDILKVIEEGVTEAEERFLNRYTRHFNPTSEDDYLLMAPLCNWGQLFPRATGFSNVGIIFLRHYILDRRPDILPIGEHREDLINGIIGWLNTNPPPREYQARIDALDKVTQDEWSHLTTDHLKTLVHLADTVYRTQSLRTLSADPHRSIDCPHAAHFSGFFREGAGYLLDEMFRDDVQQLLPVREVMSKVRESWVECIKIYSKPNTCSYT